MKLSRFVSLLWLTGSLACGSSPQGFRNQTPHTDQFLMDHWQKAQAAIAAGQVQLNPLEPRTLPAYAPADPRASEIQPDGLLVKAEADSTPAAVFAVTGIWYPAPTGLLVCSCSGGVAAAAAYSVEGHASYYAASLDRDPSLVAGMLEYEFENQILFRLGYSTQWR